MNGARDAVNARLLDLAPLRDPPTLTGTTGAGRTA